MDNRLESFPSASSANHYMDRWTAFLATGDFEIHQGASNAPSVVECLPSLARSVSCKLCLSHTTNELQEPTLGLRWNCRSDLLGFKCWIHTHSFSTTLTLRAIYRTLPSQYNKIPLVKSFPLPSGLKYLCRTCGSPKEVGKVLLNPQVWQSIG